MQVRKKEKSRLARLALLKLEQIFKMRMVNAVIATKES